MILVTMDTGHRLQWTHDTVTMDTGHRLQWTHDTGDTWTHDTCHRTQVTDHRTLDTEHRLQWTQDTGYNGHRKQVIMDIGHWLQWTQDTGHWLLLVAQAIHRGFSVTGGSNNLIPKCDTILESG